LDPIPGQSQLETSLAPLWERFKEFKLKPSSKNDKRKLNQEILAAFQRFHAWLIDEVILKHMRKDILMSGTFSGNSLTEMIDTMPQMYRNFARNFLQGQMFNFFSDHLLKIARQKKMEKMPIVMSPVPTKKQPLIKRASFVLEEIGKDLSGAVFDMLKK